LALAAHRGTLAISGPNLWDDAEARVHHLVCSRRMTVAEAQRIFIERRWAAYE
jgi:hypothetical protein